MARRLLLLGCTALALLMLTAVVDSADARHRGHGGHHHHHHGHGHHHHHWHGHHHHHGHRHHHHHRHRHLFLGAPFLYDGYYYGGSYDYCYWLRRRALRTGSRYWWNRYYACIDD